MRTVYHWEAGRCRIPFSAVRLLRFVRLGDLGALCDDWAGWTLNRLGLHDPAGRTYRLDAMRAWWITCEQAQFWREGRPSLLGASTVPSGSRGRCAAPVSGSTPNPPTPEAVGVEGGTPSGGALLPSGKRGTSSSALPRAARGTAGTKSATFPAEPLSTAHAAAGAGATPHPPSVAEASAAAAGAPGSAAGAGRAGSPAEGRRRGREGRRSAPQGAGLVSSSQQVRSQGRQPKPGKASQGIGNAP